MKICYRCKVKNELLPAGSRDGIYSAVHVRPPRCKVKRRIGGCRISEKGRGLNRCQMPCSQWDARRPGSEDVRVIGPLLRFRLLRPRGTRFGGLTEPVLSLQWKRPSWCRRGATDYRLARRREPFPPRARRAFSPPRGPARPLAITSRLVRGTRVTCRT